MMQLVFLLLLIVDAAEIPIEWKEEQKRERGERNIQVLFFFKKKS